jgi:hypothetical protein
MSASEMTRDDLEALMVLLADVRDEIVEASKTLGRVTGAPPTAEIAPRLEERVSLLARPHPPRPWRRHLWLAMPLFAALCGAGVGWYAGGHAQREIRAQARLMGQVDALFVARADTLPPAFRSALRAVYTQAGFQPPGQRTPTAATPGQTGER